MKKQRIFAVALLLALLLTAVSGCGNRRGNLPAVAHPVILGDPIATYEYGILFLSGNVALRDQVWAAMQVLSARGEVSMIARNWFGHDTTIIPGDFEATDRLGDVRERTFIIGFDPYNAPMSFFDASGEIVGFDIDLARAVCDYFGWELRAHPIDWANREIELVSGNVDALWGGINRLESVPDRLIQTDAYLENHQVVLVLSTANYRNHRALRGETLAVRNGSIGERALLENTSFADRLGDITARSSLYFALRDLSNGVVDAVIMDEVSAHFYIRTGDTAAFRQR